MKYYVIYVDNKAVYECDDWYEAHTTFLKMHTEENGPSIYVEIDGVPLWGNTPEEQRKPRFKQLLLWHKLTKSPSRSLITKTDPETYILLQIGTAASADRLMLSWGGGGDVLGSILTPTNRFVTGDTLDEVMQAAKARGIDVTALYRTVAPCQ